MRNALLLVASIAHADPSPTLAVDASHAEIEADGSDKLGAWALRLEAAHTWWRTLSTTVAISAVHIAGTDETENLSDNSLSNPSLLVSYAVPLGPFELAATTGLIPSLGSERDLARDTMADIDAARRPYEFGALSAVPLVGEARLRWRGILATVTAGAYLVDEDSVQLDDVHFAVAAGYMRERVRIEAVLHGLVVPQLSAVPRALPLLERDRWYYGFELRVRFPVQVHDVGLTIWKPFGYDREDAMEEAFVFGAAGELHF